MRKTTALIYSPKLMTTFSFKLDKIEDKHLVFQLVYCVGVSLKNLCHFEMGGLAIADVIRGVAQCAESC